MQPPVVASVPIEQPPVEWVLKGGMAQNTKPFICNSNLEVPDAS